MIERERLNEKNQQQLRKTVWEENSNPTGTIHPDTFLIFESQKHDVSIKSREPQN